MFLRSRKKRQESALLTNTIKEKLEFRDVEEVNIFTNNFQPLHVI